MKEYTPIAMRCTQEQFNAIKPKLKDIDCGSYDGNYEYLILTDGLLGQCNKYYADAEGLEIYEEWDESIFLKHCEPIVKNPLDPVFIERYNIADKVKELLKECKEQGFELDIDNGVIILKQI